MVPNARFEENPVGIIHIPNFLIFSTTHGQRFMKRYQK